jgi:hypothetical protein
MSGFYKQNLIPPPAKIVKKESNDRKGVLDIEKLLNMGLTGKKLTNIIQKEK